VEVKSVADSEPDTEPDTEPDKTKQNIVRKGADQTRKLNQLLGKLHVDILGQDWRFVRGVALPNTKQLPDHVQLCEACRQYVLDGSSLQGAQENWAAALMGPPGILDHQINLDNQIRSISQSIQSNKDNQSKQDKQNNLENKDEADKKNNKDDQYENLLIRDQFHELSMRYTLFSSMSSL
jgi:hypothetical protein